MKSRRKPEPPVLVSSLTQADAVLAEIADLDRQVRSLEDAKNSELDRIKAAAARQAAPMLERRASLELALAAWATLNRTELFPEAKTLDLMFGRLGFRKSTKIEPCAKVTWAMILGRLKELCFPEAIRVKEDVNREELHAWPAEKLALVGARRVEKDDFWYETKTEELPQEAA
ncbi:MAG: host-nuclease inhibitor Gam family protein [Thermodesulfobacteriota bacterium]